MTQGAAPSTVRDAVRGDLPHLRRMMVEASTPPWVRPRPTPAEVLRDPVVARYLVGWGRAGDTAVIAIGRDDRRTGAAWYRFFTAEAPGYGFTAPEIPELAIAVSLHHRGRGIGTALLGALLERASAEGLGAVSLSVSLVNPAALALYRKTGFSVVSEAQGHATMLWRSR